MQMSLHHENNPPCKWVNERPVLQQTIGICPVTVGAMVGYGHACKTSAVFSRYHRTGRTVCG